MHDLATITADVIEFVRRQADADVEADTDLLDAGLLDSLLVMDLVDHVESRYQVELDHNDLAPENFRTAASLADLIDQRRMPRIRAA